ncbi:MAG: peptidase M50 [Thalassospira sp.]|uniref:HlyD family efflux transporter periplasmic adaptor subunit n=1 Tax=Thalassospira sp. TaxID=1912094 RepID=UPI000C60ADE4|nr:HlyD family efflux transporter periplasmic adaptor subunit [Thalassospira sp.]MAZ31534.1 peptidase M50 [Thalassospira sp.]
MAIASQDQAKDMVVPPLREDLRLLPAGTDEYGAPCWTIHDPVRNRYFRIGYAAFEMLRRWPLRQGQAIIDRISRDTVLTIDEASLSGLIKFLHGNGLLQRDSSETVAEFSRIANAGKPPFWKWAIHNYLFVRVPLVHPDGFLRRTQAIADVIASRPVQLGVLFLGIIGIFLTLRQWDLFVSTFMGFANWQGVVWMAITLTLAKILHEFGHAYSAARYGCRVPSMGVAFLVMYPVLYTDTSDAWRIISKEKRLRIAAAGIRVELALALLATFFWHIVPPGPLQSAVFLLATTTWITTLLINLSPFMRFDGYYLLSDFLGIANLQNRSFAMAKWTIREMLFRFGHPAPEPMPRKKRRMLTVFAISVWIYRFFLFLGIALVVYHLFFKVLGIILFVVEIAWFIVIPVFSEMKHWWKDRHLAKATPSLVVTGLLLLVLAVLTFVPWQSRVSADAVLQAGNDAEIISTVAGQIAEITVKKGDRVRAGDTIAILNAPELDAEHRIRELELAEARILLAQTEASRDDLGDYATRLQEMRRLAARIVALEARQDLLTLRAPIDGFVRELTEDLRVGDWIAPRTPIARIVGASERSAWEVVAYVSQRDIARIGNEPSAKFYPEQVTQPVLEIGIGTVERFNSTYIEAPALAAVHGGTIAATVDREGRYTPHDPVFKVEGIVATGKENTPVEAGFSMMQRGTLQIDAEPMSWARRLYEAVVAGFIREVSF